MKSLQLTNISLCDEKVDFYLSEDSLLYPYSQQLKEKILVKDFLENKESIDKFQIETRNLYNQILPVLANYFNYIHKERKGVIYWERIFGFWLNTVIVNYLDKMFRLEKAIELFPNINITTLSESSFQRPLNMKEFVYSLRVNPYFHLQQYSLVLENISYNNISYKHKNWTIKEYTSSIDRGNSKKKSFFLLIRERIVSIMDKGYQSSIVFYLSLFSNNTLLNFYLKSWFHYAPIIDDSIPEYKSEKLVRSEIKKFTTNNNLADSILYTSFEYFFPIELYEKYKGISEGMEVYLNKNIPKAIFTGIGLLWNSQFVIWAAKSAEKGSKLFGMQHGGTYGEVKILDWELLERKLTDSYITWGWKEDTKTIPLPAARLIERKRTKFVEEKNDIILWVTTADSRFNYFVGHIVFGNKFLKYFEHQQDLYALFDEDIQNKINIRLYADDFGWKMRERWLDKFRNIKFANNKENFIQQSLNSKLVIIDHFGGTTFLELISLNIPVIVIGNIDLFSYRDQSVSFYEDLKKVGVFYSSKESAALEIKEILKDVKKWSENKERKEAIEKFKKNFAMKTISPTTDWMKFLKTQYEA
jgi:putative transferase (TIGR04331 family)